MADDDEPTPKRKWTGREGALEEAARRCEISAFSENSEIKQFAARLANEIRKMTRRPETTENARFHKQ
jgi:hypothetical protein